MNKKSKIIGLASIILGIAFLAYREFFVAGITTDGFVIDAFGYIAAGLLFVIIGSLTLVISKFFSIKKEKINNHE